MADLTLSGSTTKRRLARAAVQAGGAGVCAVALALISGCTVENGVNDTAEGNAASNDYQTGPSARSASLWIDPGENLLAALSEVEASDRDSVLPVENRVLGNLFGEVGAYFSATTNYTPFGRSLERQTMPCDDDELPDAVETLCASLSEPRRIGGTRMEESEVQLVLIDELPHVAYQRSLARKLLSCAWDAGFRYLGVEALEEDDAALEARGHVSRTQSGEFTREPQMSRLFDDGIRLGYDIVSYQIADPCSECRHIPEIVLHAEEQADNLIAKTFAIDPAAKVLVLTSARQAYKYIWGPSGPYTKSLGAWIWEKSNIEPYSIGQVPVDRPSLQFGASQANPPSGMYVATGILNGQCQGSYSQGSPSGMGLLDATVIHVPPHTDAERWDWVHAPAEERRTVTPSCASCTAGERVLLQAFPAGIDRTDRVPVDQALCAVGEACQLSLPPARYDVVVWREGVMMGPGEADLEASEAATVSL